MAQFVYSLYFMALNPSKSQEKEAWAPTKQRNLKKQWKTYIPPKPQEATSRCS